ncbi:MAG: dihydropteroate synthase [Planctomycetota bacterium]
MTLLDDLRFPPPPKLMGILNVTPDSFADGGRHDTLESALAHGRRLVAEGADVIDVGGESSRPGADAVAADEQIRRVAPVIAQLHREFPAVPLSVDTRSSDVAHAAVQAGATWINDISGGHADPQLMLLAAYTGSTLVLMHMQGTPATMQARPNYTDVVAEVESYLLDALKAARGANIPDTKIWLDPGIGFGKTLEHNRKLLHACERWAALGWSLLVGHSRKSFIEKAWREAQPMPARGSLPPLAAMAPAAPSSGAPVPPGAHDLPPDDRLPGTLAISLRCWLAGVRMLRVHDVAAHRQAFALFRNDVSRYI